MYSLRRTAPCLSFAFLVLATGSVGAEQAAARTGSSGEDRSSKSRLTEASGLPLAAPPGKSRNSAQATAGATPQSFRASSPRVSGGSISGELAYERGQWSTAIALFEAIPLKERAASQQLVLARSRVQLGLWLEALDDYETLLAPQSPRRALPGGKKQQSLAEAEGAALGRRLPWAKLDFGTSAPAGSSVFVDGHWVSPGRFEAPYPVNPGWHTFLLEVDGQVQAAQRMYFEEQQHRVVRLTHPSPKQSDGPASAIFSSNSAAPSQLSGMGALGSQMLGNENNSVTQDGAGQSSWRTVSYLGLGVGAAAIAAGVGFAIDASLAHDRLLKKCVNVQNDAGCLLRAEDSRLRSRFQRSAEVSSAAFTAGVLSLVSGGVMWYLTRSDDEHTVARQASVLAVQPFVGLQSAGLVGQF